jgi:predicted DNA binding CopG/RHH family protein
MKKITLDKEEKQLLKDVENGEFKSVKNLKSQIAYFKKVAAETIKKSKNVNIRMTEEDWYKLKTRAAKNGLPYQTLMATILHQYVDGKIEIKL